MNLKNLALPFKENEIEWRIGQCGKKGNGQIWAMCLAYVQARAVMDRLDEVCGPENWKVEYAFIGNDGVIARLAIQVDGQWVFKEDGAEKTDIESFKGGISSALKRAASVWGIGRYLYGLESGFANIVSSKTDKSKWGKTKDGHEFNWEPPCLPSWALPIGEKAEATGGIHPGVVEQGNGDTTPSGIYRVTFGKYTQKSLEELYNDPKVGPEGLASYIQFLEDAAIKKNVELAGAGLEFVTRCADFLGAMENKAIDPNFDREPGDDRS